MVLPTQLSHETSQKTKKTKALKILKLIVNRWKAFLGKCSDWFNLSSLFYNWGWGKEWKPARVVCDPPLMDPIYFKQSLDPQTFMPLMIRTDAVFWHLLFNCKTKRTPILFWALLTLLLCLERLSQQHTELNLLICLWPCLGVNGYKRFKKTQPVRQC